MTVTYPPGTPLHDDREVRHQPRERHHEGRRNQVGQFDGRTQAARLEQRRSATTTPVSNAQTVPERRHDTYKIIDQIRKLGYLVPGGDFQVSGDSGGGSGASIFYSLSGPEDAIAPAAEKVAQFLRDTPGSVNVQTSNEAAAPRLNVNIDAQKAEVLGVSPATAANAARFAIDGAVATRVRAENGLVDVRVQFPLAERKTVDQLNARPRARRRTERSCRSPTSRISSGRRRRCRSSASTVSASSTFTAARCRDTRSVPSPVRSSASSRSPGFLPEGVHLTAQGDTQFMNETMANMGVALLTSFMLVYMLMVILYGSFLEPLIVMFCVPLAIIGALVGALADASHRADRRTIAQHHLDDRHHHALRVGREERDSARRLLQHALPPRTCAFATPCCRRRARDSVRSHDDVRDDLRHAAALAGLCRRRRVAASRWERSSSAACSAR